MSRIGTVGYLNARPLSDHVDIDRHTLVKAHPAEVARMLRDREVDVALVPVAAVFSDPGTGIPGSQPGYKIVPGFCIGSEGPVASVLIAAETPPEQWTKVVLDGVSRTSVVLARLLLEKGPLSQRVRKDLEIVQGAPNTAVGLAKKTVAAVMIGDAARQLPERLTVRIDLASEWREWTGLPFVFAVWAGRADLDPSVVQHLADVGAKGVAGLRDSYLGADLKYLTENLRYPLDDRALVGLRRFASLARNAGLLPSDEFELYGPEPMKPRPDVDLLLARALDGGALPIGEVLALLRYAPVADLAAAADLKRRERYPGDVVQYRIDVVLAEGDPETIRPAIVAGATRIRLVGPVDEARVRAVAKAYPGVAIEGGAPSDGDLGPLVAAGLTHVSEEPVGAFSDRVRAAIGAPSASEWLSWAIRSGLPLSATVAVGQGETEEELVAHLLRLRDLPGLVSVRVWAADGKGPLGSVANTATDHLRALTVARLVLPSAVRLAASPETEGLGMAQASLRAGCDHAGVIVLDGPADGWAARIEGLEHNVREAGFTPVRERVALRGPLVAASVPDAVQQG